MDCGIKHSVLPQRGASLFYMSSHYSPPSKGIPYILYYDSYEYSDESLYVSLHMNVSWHISLCLYSHQLVGNGLHNPVDIFMRWPNLKKIFLTCGRWSIEITIYICVSPYHRAIGDDDVVAIASFCPQLEQFDILGSNRVTANSVSM